MAKFGTLEWTTEQANKARDEETKRMQDLMREEAQRAADWNKQENQRMQNWIQQDAQQVQERDRQQRQKLLDDQRAAETNRHLDELAQAVKDASAKQALQPKPAMAPSTTRQHPAPIAHKHFTHPPQSAVKPAPIVHHSPAHPAQAPGHNLVAHDPGSTRTTNSAGDTDPNFETEVTAAKLRQIAGIQPLLAKHIGERPATAVVLATGAAVVFSAPYLLVAAGTVGILSWWHKKQTDQAAINWAAAKSPPSEQAQAVLINPVTAVTIVDQPARKMMPLSDVPTYGSSAPVKAPIRSQPRRHGNSLQACLLFVVGLLAVCTTLTAIAAFVVWYVR